MADAFTAKCFQYGRAPRKIRLKGNKTKAPESAQHIIEFPGGAIELSRTTDGNYWAHIIINRDFRIEEAEGLVSAFGEIIGSRIDYAHPHKPIIKIPKSAAVRQIAILVRPRLHQSALKKSSIVKSRTLRTRKVKRSA